MTSQAVVLFSGPDRPGLVAATTRLLFECGANIIHADHHLDRTEDMFFQRIEFELADGAPSRAQLEERLDALCRGLSMTWALHDRTDPRRTAVLVSRQDHCLYDLLLRQRAGELQTEFACVISNHPDAREVAQTFGLPFHHLPVTRETRPAQEAALLALLRDYDVALVVLARYMQILSEDFLDQIGRPIVNIHHSFLPAFSGERPYHRAYERGVKLIGATAHYVTAELDAGPIIEQGVVRTSHADQLEDFVRKGRDVEKQVLSRAVRLHLEDRVLLHQNKTVVFG
jgi:formyltetrahydrofolate deformylase